MGDLASLPVCDITQKQLSKSQGKHRRSRAGDEPTVARELDESSYGVQATGKDRASGAKSRVPRVAFIRAVEHWMSWKCERADPAARDSQERLRFREDGAIRPNCGNGFKSNRCQRQNNFANNLSVQEMTSIQAYTSGGSIGG